jgi:phage tail-like protein
MTRQDPFGGYNFAVEIDGITSMGFKTCSGLDSSTTAGTYREGTDPTLGQRKLPGLLSFSNITLSRGIISDHSLWDWRSAVAGGDLQRRDLSIILRNDKGEEQIRWNVSNAWPTKWTGPSFDATSDAVAIETLELAHEGIEVQKW